MIPEAAVEAAAKYLAVCTGSPGAVWTIEARAILEAASPHIRAQALLDAAETLEMQPPMLRAQYVATLRLYSAEPWRLTTCPSECASGHPGREHGVTT